MYSFDLNDRAFNAIKAGTKRVEIRVTRLDGSFDYSVIKCDDLIRFKNSANKLIKCRVVKVNWYSTIEELLTSEGTKYTLSSTDDFLEGVKSINNFDGYTEGMKENGVYAIHLEYQGEDKYKLDEFTCVDEDIDLDEYIRFRENVRDRMSEPSWLGDISKEGLQEMLDVGGKIWMYYDGEIPVCSIMFIPAGDDVSEHLDMIDIDYMVTGDIGPLFVNFDYLGNGLQKQMLKVYDEYLKSKGYKYVMTTIHPDNVYCRQNMEEYGLKQVAQKVFKRGIRNVYFKEL